MATGSQSTGAVDKKKNPAVGALMQPEYEDLVQIFSPTKAMELLPHRDWDCTITLKEGAVPPSAESIPSPKRKNRQWTSTSWRHWKKVHLPLYFSSISQSLLCEEEERWGPCVDYWGLNKLLLQYLYPLPLVPAVLEQLRGARYFTNLDQRSTYHLIWVKEGDEWKTAFSTSTGHYEILPYGLATAPSIFQAYINEF
ncbi:hypothetical protein P4O66_003370 [Electrophorus voltai]|uniref:Reverse transcriptase domain-containing protein n=1 Tax=Electrophorus voltai TaxID=2609070 RepID=A0AAD8YRN8_9TELE|nr:hypothetical protein P4O66_003370 [Electrophorus voltai]